MNAIELSELRTSYGRVEVLRGIDLQVPRGCLLALLGPNGAGKTTVVRILATLLRFDAGTAAVFGHDVRREADAVRRRVALTGQFASVDDELTGRENLVLIALLLGYPWAGARARADELLRALDLEEAAGRRVKGYSGGMRRRLDIAASIVVTPDLLFLDEPTTGLDPRSRRSIWRIVRALRDAGTTVLLTTQYMEEADELADRVVILDRGAIIADGAPGELKTSVGSGVLRLRLRDAGQRSEADRVVSRILGTPPQRGGDPAVLSVQVAAPERLAALIASLSEAGIAAAEFALEQPSLDDVFLALTGQAIGAGAGERGGAS